MSALITVVNISIMSALITVVIVNICSIMSACNYKYLYNTVIWCVIGIKKKTNK